MGRAYVRDMENYLRANPNKDITGQQLADAVGCFTTDPAGVRRYSIASNPLKVLAEGSPVNSSYRNGREPMENLSYTREDKSWGKAIFRYHTPAAAPVTTSEDRAEYVQLIGDMAEIIVQVSKALTRIEDRLETLEKVWS